MSVIPYGRQTITEEDKKVVLSVLESDFLTQGPWVEKFEKSVAQFIQAKHAVAVTNGTAALHLAAMALGVKAGDKVIVTANTFAASANCIRYCGGDVEFADIDKDNYCLDLALLEKKLQANPGTYKGIVCVDFAGYPVDFEKLRKIADKHSLWIIEDACHALGAQFKNSQGEMVFSGNSRYAEASVFSFHPVKHIATGEGGMITTSNDKLYAQLLKLRTHGITKDSSLFEFPSDGGWYYEMQELGFNYRISDILCALGASQMTRIEENLRRRREIAKRYDKELQGTGLILPVVENDRLQAYHLYVVQSEKRNDLYNHLRENGVYPQVHYIPVHRLPYYRELYGEISLPVAEKYYSRALSLPMYHGMTDDEQTRVISVIKSFKS